MAVMGASLEKWENGWRCFYSKPLQQDMAAEKVALHLARDAARRIV
jgi:hypothetical protein